MSNTFGGEIYINEEKDELVFVEDSGKKKTWPLSPLIKFFPNGEKRTAFQMKEEILRQLRKESNV